MPDVEGPDMIRWVGCVVAAIAMGASGALAQSYPNDDVRHFGPFLVMPSIPEVAMLAGEIQHNAPLDFRRLIRNFPQVRTLALDSRGGDVTAAILLAQEVAFLGFSTFVPEESSCLSACSFIFFAGESRLVEGQLGVHQISGAEPDDYSTQVAIADIIDALADYDVPQSVISDMLRTPPSSMTVYTAALANQLGINRDVGAAVANTPVPQAQAAPPPNVAMSKIGQAEFEGDTVGFLETTYQLHEPALFSSVFLAAGFDRQDVSVFSEDVEEAVGSAVLPAWTQISVTTWPWNGTRAPARVSLYLPEPPDGRITHRVTLALKPDGRLVKEADPFAK